jgi:hypothetical protein
MCCTAAYWEHCLLGRGSEQQPAAELNIRCTEGTGILVLLFQGGVVSATFCQSLSVGINACDCLAWTLQMQISLHAFVCRKELLTHKNHYWYVHRLRASCQEVPGACSSLSSRKQQLLLESDACFALKLLQLSQGKVLQHCASTQPQPAYLVQRCRWSCPSLWLDDLSFKWHRLHVNNTAISS